MSRAGRKNKQNRRNAASDWERFNRRYLKRYFRAGRKVNGDRHMKHLWFPISNFDDPRTPAPIHNGRKPK